MVIWCSDVLCQNENPCADTVNNELVNNPAFCGNYFHCIEQEIGLDGNCPEETPVFNTITRQCDTLENYFCEDIVSTDAPDPCTGLDNDVKVNNPESCGAYWTCIEETAALPGLCVGELPVFNPTTGQCDTVENYECFDEQIPDEEVPDRCDGKENGWFINDPSHCHAYFVCWNNRISLSGRCNDLNFNEAEQLCDWQYQCISPPTTTAEPETTTVEIEIETPTPEPETDSRCPASGIFNIMKPGSCVDYFLCINGIAMPRSCLPTLHFDSELGGCNREDVVRCLRNECPIKDEIDSIVFLESPWSCSE